MNTIIDNSRISKHLGKVSEYKTQYDPSLLVAEPRINNRRLIGIPDGDLPFRGFDVWNAYETTFLLESGVPVNVITKIIYSCDSPYIVESKSIKLYLNSFNMQRMGRTRDEAVESFRRTVSGDLGKLLQTDVQVYCTTPFMYELSQTNPLKAYEYFVSPVVRKPMTDDIIFIDLDESFYNRLNAALSISNANPGEYFTFTDYTENRKLLTQFAEPSDNGKEYHYRLRSALLRSNCRVTGQPDFGDIFIEIKSRYALSLANILKYIVSYRSECHFHEESNEGIFFALKEAYKPSILNVTTLYSRRGGIDINSARSLSTGECLQANADLITNPAHSKTSKQ